MSRLATIVEADIYSKQAARIFSEAEHADFVVALAGNPYQGDLIPGTGGLRKIRVAVGKRGKSGGARVIYYFYNYSMPLLLLACYTKSAKTNLSAAEKKMLTQLVEDFLDE